VVSCAGSHGLDQIIQANTVAHHSYIRTACKPMRCHRFCQRTYGMRPNPDQVTVSLGIAMDPIDDTDFPNLDVVQGNIESIGHVLFDVKDGSARED